MDTHAAAEHVPPPRPARRWPWVVAALLLVVAALAGTAAWLATTDGGLRAALAAAQRYAPVTIEAEGVQGALTREFGVERLRVVAGGTTVDIAGLRARLRGIGADPPRLDFETLAARRVEVRIAPGAEPSSGVPDSIASPVAVSARQLQIGELAIAVGGTTLAASALAAQAAIGPEGYRIADGRLVYAGLPVTLAGQLGGAKPFALALHGELSGSLRDRAVQARWRTDGSLVDLALAVDVEQGAARGQASARLAAFDTPVLKSLQADLDGIDLHAWDAGLPTTLLSVRADLRPDAAATTLSGTLQLANAQPGTLDAARLPLRDARAEVELTRAHLRAERLVATLVRGAVSGRAALRFGTAPQWDAELRLDGVDPAAIHAKARPLRIDGTARLRQAGGGTTIQAALRNRGDKVVDARLDLRLDAQRLDIARAELTLGRGRLAASGQLGLTGPQPVRLEGTIDRFEPGLLIKDVDAIISGRFALDAKLAPQPSGQLQFELTDSRAYGRPLTGHGQLRIDAAQQLDVDLALAARSARFNARGGLGEAGRRLTVTLEAPALEELLPGLHGSVNAQASASGAWNAPAVEARLTARDLRAADQSLQRADLNASYSGGTDGRLSLRADAGGHVYRDRPALSLRSASLAVDGSAAAHSIALRGTTADARDLAVAAQGGWDGRRWQGVLREATYGGPLALRLLDAAALAFGTGKLEFGPAALNAAGARFDAVRLTSDGAGLRSSGSFDGLQPQTLLTASGSAAVGNGGAASGTGPAPPPPLTLRGQWQIDLGAQANGRLSVQRSGGDITTGGDADGALLLRELQLEATLVANRLSAHALARSERGGNAEASLSALVEHDAAAGWRLAQQQPWQLDAQAQVPSLGRVHRVLGEPLGSDIRVNGRLAAQLTLTGTPGNVQARGSLEGEALRLAWIEQGLRLENGRLRARLDGDQLLLDELRFVGTPRERPKDPRLAGKVALEREGTLSASGRLRLRDADGTIRVQADHLPLLQRPDRWVIASGEAGLTATRERLQLAGSFKADAGYLEATRSGLPSLSSDVVVVRSGADASQREPRYAIVLDIALDLGPAFYIKAAGLDARAEGVLRLRSAGRGAITASGSIEAKDGRYEGFGQRLTIRRGRVNFQGPPDNPSLDVLAVREGLPVVVGVTVTRNVSNPLVRLYSDPPMGDPETMSWLVFGHAGEQTRADNLSLLQTAAGALTGGEEGITDRFAKSLGIDDVTLRSGEFRSTGSLLPQSSVAGDLRGDRSTTPSANQQILSVGKRINDSITLTFEQALGGTDSVVQLAYRLSQRLSIVARAGTENAFDLVYSWAFD